MRSKIFDTIQNSDSILLLTHKSPDGDAVGSVLAVYHYLLSINKNVYMVILDVPKVFNFLPSINKVVDNVDGDFDLGIVVDCATKERIGQNIDLFSKCKKTICIDHHTSNTNYCDINYVCGNISSCCQVIYSLFMESGITINKEIGEALMSGVLTDTNGFSINNVDVDTFLMAADMKKTGIDVHFLYNNLLCKKSMSQHNLSKIGLDRLEFLYNNKIAWTYILESDFILVGAGSGEHEGIVDIGRNIDGVEVSIFVREDKDGFTVSFRSSGKINVNNIASKFGGGGHMMAAGAKINNNLQETKKLLIDETIKAIDSL